MTTRIENRKALTAARFPGGFENRLTPPIVTMCPHCPTGESIAAPVLLPVEGLDAGLLAQVVQENARRLASDMEARAKPETARTFKTRKAWREHCKTAHKEAK